MLNIGSLLEKFKNLKNPQETKNAVGKIISRCINHELTDGDFILRDGTVVLLTSGYVKTEIFMRKNDILNALAKEGMKEVKDIQ